MGMQDDGEADCYGGFCWSVIYWVGEDGWCDHTHCASQIVHASSFSLDQSGLAIDFRKRMLWYRQFV